MGGLYFQGIFIALVYAVGGTLGLPGCEAAVVWSNFLMVRSLNPFLRMDGYWLVNDLAGSTGFRRESREALREIWRAWGGGSGGGSWWKDISRSQWLMAAYCVASVGVFAALYSRAIAALVVYVLPGIVRSWTNAVDALVSGLYGVAMEEAGALLWQVGIGALLCYVVGRFVQRTVIKPARRRLGKAWKRG